MLISDFAKAAGLSTDTVRFYVRRGLLQPATGAKGGSNPYQVFTEEDVEAARIIRLAQSLGFSLREIGALSAEYRSGPMTPERSIAIMTGQLDRLDDKARQLDAMRTYLRAKIAWLEQDETGPVPRLSFEGAPVACSMPTRIATALPRARGHPTTG